MGVGKGVSKRRRPSFFIGIDWPIGKTVFLTDTEDCRKISGIREVVCLRSYPVEASLQTSKKQNSGLERRMHRAQFCIFSAGISIIFALLFPMGGLAQLAPGGAPGGFYSNSKLEPIDNSSLAVQVRAPNGSTLDTLALVTLCNLSGQVITR